MKRNELEIYKEFKLQNTLSSLDLYKKKIQRVLSMFSYVDISCNKLATDP